MTVRSLFTIFAALLAAASTAAAATKAPYAQARPLALRRVTPDRQSLPRYGRLTLDLDLSATYDNPFDPEQIDAWAVFTPPAGRPVRVNAFLDQPFSRKLVDGKEVLSPAGEPVWRVRYTPDRVGTWRCRVSVKDRSGQVSAPEVSFRVTPSSAKGFIRRSAKNPRAFAFSDGTPFFAVGENMDWPGPGGTFDYDTWLSALGKAGGNWIRVWMCSWNAGLEWTGEGFLGAGAYNLANAWKADAILDAAAKNGIAVMLCFGTYGELTTGGFFNEGQWKDNPYNAANGGPCASPEDFWTNPAARKLYQRRLRYLAARYGSRTNLHAWEFWNEAQPRAPWVAEMARYMKGTGEFKGAPADACGHLVTTSYGDDAVWRIPEIDFSQSHSYGMGDIPDHAPVVHAEALKAAAFGKPHLMAEFGIDWRKSDIEYDPDARGVNLHNGLWAAAASGDAGGAMIWWWDSYIHPKNLYAPFTALRRFADAVPWTAGPWTPLKSDPPRLTTGSGPRTDLVIPATLGWGRAPASTFTVTPSGLEGSAGLPQFLYAPAKADLRTVPEFRLTLSAPSRFVAHLDALSNTALVRISLDGETVLEKKLSAAPPEGGAAPDYRSTEFKKEYGIYQAEMDMDLSVDVPAGTHRLAIENADGDWVRISRVTFERFGDNRAVPAQVYGMRSGQNAILWVQHRRHTWEAGRAGTVIPPIRGARTLVRDLPAGRYRVEWWDTEKGVVSRRETVSAAKGGLPLRLPDVSTDVAARIAPLP